jgi:ribosomal protein S6--L-glutamate ligase
VTRIGIISAYPEEDWHAQRIAAAAERRGEVSLLAPTDFGAVMPAPGGDEAPHVTVAGEDARAFDLFLTPRAIGDIGDHDLQVELYRALAEAGALVVNDVRALTRAIDKFRSSWIFSRAGLHAPRVVVAQRLAEAERALARFGRVVVKPLYGSLGIGVELIDAGNRSRLADLIERHGALYLQAYVERASHDVRAFVVGDRVVAAVARRARPGEFRANIHQGANAESIELQIDASDLAVRAAQLIGLDYAGVDLLLTSSGPVLLEVNGTPSFRAIEEATGRDMAAALVEHAVARAEAQRGRRRWRPVYVESGSE